MMHRKIFRPMTSCVPKYMKSMGSSIFLPTDLFASRGQSMGCIAKSFKADIQEVNGYLCAKNE